MAEQMKVQKEKIIAVIKAEQTLIAGVMANDCGDAGHCAIGALLTASGFTKRALESIRAYPDLWPRTGRAARTMAADYGLTRILARNILDTNDIGPALEHHDIEARRRRVIQAVRDLPDEIEVELSVSRVLPNNGGTNQ